MIHVLAHGGSGGAGGGSALASWTPLTTLLGLLVLGIVVALVTGRAPADRHPVARVLLRIPDALERRTGVAGWAVATVGLSLYGLLVAGVGFYSDVAWHVALGRDEELFTAPHTAIVVGLFMIAAAAGAGILFATLTGAEVGARIGRVRVPWSTLPLGLLGLSAVSGFPLDELWHAEFGIDVTMWSPTHMLMIVGASLSGLASWLVLAEARVPVRGTRWQRGLHYVAAWLTFQGLVSSQGEFAFGVPQFQQLFHPVLVSLAAAFALVAMRIVLGARAMLGVALATFVLEYLDPAGAGGPIATRAGGLYLVSAVVVAAVGALVGVRDRLRFALLSALGIGTVGLAGEFAWNAGAYQPWNASLLPEAVVLSLLVAAGAAVLGAAFAAAVNRERSTSIPPVALVAAGLAVLVALAVPMPRRVGDVTADLTLDRVDDGHAFVQVRLEPPDAADDARWFQAVTWQGGTLELADMEEVGDGVYRSSEPVPVTGGGKAMIRLHRGDELMVVPVRFPADPEIGAPAITAEDRTQPFEGEGRYLMREARPGDTWFAWVLGGLVLALAASWVAAFVLAGSRLLERPAAADAARRVRRRPAATVGA